jgi:thiosulfate dehydrogenase [quinone] large subunit
MLRINSALIKKIILFLGNDKPFLSIVRKRQFFLLSQAIFGLLWLEGALWKIMIEGKFALNYDGLAYWISRGTEYPVLAPYEWLIDNAILPNIKLFLPIVFLTELTIGILFFTGKYIRFAALLAIAQTIAIMLSVLNTPFEWKWSYFLMLLVSAMFFVMPTISAWPNKLLRRK